MVCLTVIFFNNQQIITVLLSKLSWSAFRRGGGGGGGGTRSQYFIPEAELFQPVADPDRVTRFLELGENSQI